MMNTTNLSLREFLTDVRRTITSPAGRFAVIKERRALWGSLAFLIVPAYLGSSSLSGIFFDEDPFPGYSFVIPAVAATLFSLIKVGFIHGCARLFEGKKQPGGGKFRELLSLIGYTSVPAILALLIPVVAFILFPAQFGVFVRDFRIVSVSVMVALGIALFIWNLILMVLAMRVVYRLRDIQIVVALLLGMVLQIIPALGFSSIHQSSKVGLEYVRPVLAERILRFFAADPGTQPSGKTDVSVQADLLKYRVKPPERFDLVLYQVVKQSDERGREGRVTMGGSSMFSLGEQALGRIVGLPGDEVELAGGRLVVNGRSWDEPYIPPEFRSGLSIPAVRLGGSDYMIFPEDRRMLQSLRNDVVVPRARISGRAIVNKWPLGWWFHRPTVFLRPVPAVRGSVGSTR